MNSPVDKGQQQLFIGASAALAGLGTTAVALRCYTRQFIRRKLGKDDWMMIVAWLFTIGLLFEYMYSVKEGMGFHINALSYPNLVALTKMALSIEVTYYFTVTAIKISILFFYLELAGTPYPKFGVICWITIGFLTSYLVGCVLVTLMQCLPINKIWDFTNSVPGACIDTTIFFYTTSAINILTDIFILGLPSYVLYGMQKSTRDRLALVLVFGIGIFACIASIVRLYSIRVFTLSTDPFYDAVAINLWSLAEINVAIVCASTAAIKPLFSSYFGSQKVQVEQSNADVLSKESRGSAGSGSIV